MTKLISIRSLIWYLFAWSFLLWGSLCADEPQIGVAKLTETPPVIDGDLHEPCWASAPATTAFFNYGERTPARQKTVLKILYTRTQFFVGVQCFEEVMSDVQSGFAQPDVQDQYSGRYSIEFFLKPRDNTMAYYQFAANINDMRFDCRHAVNRQDFEWRSGFVAKSKLLSDSWTMEFAIPAASMGIQEIHPGDRWGFGLCRNNTTNYAIWAGMTARQTLLDPAGFGLLLFGDLAQWWTQRVRGALTEDIRMLATEKQLTDAYSVYWLDALRTRLAELDLEAPMTEARFPAIFDQVVGLERAVGLLKSRREWKQQLGDCSQP